MRTCRCRVPDVSLDERNKTYCRRCGAELVGNARVITGPGGR